MVTTAIKLGEKKRQDFYMRTGNTRRLLVTVKDANDAVMDAANLSSADFVLNLSGGAVSLNYLNGIVLVTGSDGKKRPRVDIEAGYTVGAGTQDAGYELVLTFGDDRDSVLFGKCRIEASLAEPDPSEPSAG